MRVISGKTQMKYQAKHEAALDDMVDAVNNCMSSGIFSDLSGKDQAREVVETMLYEQPHLWQELSYDKPTPRVWYYARDYLYIEEQLWFERGGDEYGNRPWCFRIPFGGQLCVIVGRKSNRLENPNAGIDL